MNKQEIEEREQRFWEEFDKSQKWFNRLLIPVGIIVGASFGYLLLSLS